MFSYKTFLGQDPDPDILESRIRFRTKKIFRIRTEFLLQQFLFRPNTREHEMKVYKWTSCIN
jgi:hypothetical protein